MGSLKEMFHSAGFQAFMKKLLIYALIIFVLGILFLIFKWQGGVVMTIVGGATLIFWVLFYLLGKIIG